MFWFILFIILVLIALGVAFFAPTTRIKVEDAGYKNVDGRREFFDARFEDFSFKKFAWIPAILAVICLFFSSFAVVGTRNVGVEKFMSATTGRTMDAGFHWKAPWNSVDDIDATIQPEEYTTSNPIKVKIGDLGEAEVALAYRWRVNPAHADDAYKDYHNADDITKAIRKALVSTNIKSSLNEELGTYNPMHGVVISANMTPEDISKITIPAIPYAQLNKAVKANLKEKVKGLGGLVTIQSVNIEHLELPASTQRKLNAFNTKQQDSKNALIDVAIKAAQARGNEKLAKSLRDPDVLVSKCLDGLIDGDIPNQPGFSCWQGGGSGVVIPSTK